MKTFLESHCPFVVPISILGTLLALGVGLGGCASSEGLSTEGKIATSSGLWSGNALSSSKTQFGKTWPATDWWQALGDAQLDQLIKEALQGNPDLDVADARVRQAAAMAMNADASRSVSVKATTSIQGIHLPGKVISPTSDDQYFTPKILGLSGSYNADLWGGEKAAWEAALGQQHASEVDAKAARLALSVDVARTYAQLGYDYEAHDLAQKDTERTQHLLKLTVQRVTAGIDSISQQRQAEALAASAEQKSAQAAHAIESERIALAILIGKGPDRANAIARPKTLQPMALALPDNLPAELIGRRPDIVAARWRVEAAQHDIDSAKAGFYPSFNLTAAVGLVSFHTSDLISLRSRYYSVAPAISLPIFDGGRLRANLAGRNSEYDIAVAQYNKTLAGAFNQVALQIQAGQSLSAQEASQQQSVSAAREAWQMAMERYRRGIGSYVEALTVEQSVLAAETSLTAIRTQQVDTAIQLVHALGGGYGTESTEQQTPQTSETNKASS